VARKRPSRTPAAIAIARTASIMKANSALTLTKPDPLLLKIIDPANAQLFF
jgi:hypothetical protein